MKILIIIIISLVVSKIILFLLRKDKSGIRGVSVRDKDYDSDSSTAGF